MDNRSTFLVAQRSKENANFIAEIIAMYMPDAQVIATSSGDECLDALLARGFRAGHSPLLPTAVFLDSLLDGLFGVEVVLKMREVPALRYVPIVVLTFSDSEEDRASFWTAGVNAYVPLGPVAGADLEPLHVALQFWSTINRSISP